MDLLNGQGARLPAAFLARLFPCNPMEPCAVPLIARFTRKNVDRNVMGLCASCMPGALAIAGPARCGNSVKNIPRPKNRDESVPCFGLLLLILSLLLFLHPRRYPLFLRLLPCSGAIGRVATCAATGFTPSAAKPLPLPGDLPAGANYLTRMATPRSPPPSAPALLSPATVVCLPMPV